MMTALRAAPAGHRLGELLTGIASVPESADREVLGLAMDSRQVQAGDLFLACAGHQAHGLDYLDEVLTAGAVAVAWEPAGAWDETRTAAFPTTVPLIGVPKLGEQVGMIADRFFGHPSQDMFVVGVTGTNGKTSCSQFLAQALDRAGQRCGVMGTLGYGLYGELDAASHTTPDALSLQRSLAMMRDRGVRHVVMEASSHGLMQGRVNGVAFDLALWTNLSHEHLDYHGDMANYAAAKQRLFHSPGLRYAVVNLDDAYGRGLLAELPSHIETVAYGFSDAQVPAGSAVVRGTGLTLTASGMRFQVSGDWGEGELNAGLLGRFNASNLLGVLASLLVMGMPLGEALERLAQVKTVPGRMERFGGGGKPLVVVDYAHTPDALEQALTALREHTRRHLWCVFGCGGERDRAKRPAMGAAAERLADRVVITDDNPRREDPVQIVTNIMAGMKDPDRAYVKRNREQAIHFAIGYAQPGDVVLVAGKGHEDYQIVGERRLPFSDRTLVAKLLGEVQP